MKIINIVMLLVSVTSCMIHPLRAAEPDCSAIETSAQLDNCIHKDTMNSEITLVNELKNFENRVMQLYSADLALGQEFIAVVREAQNAWLVFRDKSCKIEAFEIEKDSAAYITTINNCTLQMNSKRIEVLNNLL
ncbi:lysozyme inhibitor LprI family protein [Sessilibacter corallicola]|uniref:DUF1311 domain-containing protein n=1 Tax=Sessilibacter corallicola TaxID=2904075 RepID=A0ABQ0ADX1_9GAMM